LRLKGEEYLGPLGLTPYALAQNLGVPRYLGTTPDFWVNLQSLYDLTIAEQQVGNDIATIKPVKAA